MYKFKVKAEVTLVSHNSQVWTDLSVRQCARLRFKARVTQAGCIMQL